MAKVITFSRTFPAYHPKAGQPTYFVEKFWESQQRQEVLTKYIQDYKSSNDFNYTKYGAKHHTIRAGKRRKEGDYFSPRVWSGKPYNTSQIIIAPDTLITKIYDFEINDRGYVFINGKRLWTDLSTPLIKDIKEIATNDGLSSEDLLAWFKYPKPFSGQIICWNESVNY